MKSSGFLSGTFKQFFWVIFQYFAQIKQVLQNVDDKVMIINKKPSWHLPAES